VIGIDIRPSLLEKAKERAQTEGVADRCEFTLMTDAKADLVISIDAFEHFEDPQMILEIIHDHLKRNGQLILCFGPTWYHPRGGHLFSVFPWAHLVFSEKALCRWRSTIRSDGAMHFRDVEGGLNQMTIARFEKLVEGSRFRLEEMEMIPIRPLRRIHNPLTREFTTSMVRARLVPR
jgi:SAM-dependent methyltransferase